MPLLFVFIFFLLVKFKSGQRVIKLNENRCLCATQNKKWFRDIVKNKFIYNANLSTHKRGRWIANSARKERAREIERKITKSSVSECVHVCVLFLTSKYLLFVLNHHQSLNWTEVKWSGKEIRWPRVAFGVQNRPMIKLGIGCPNHFVKNK